MAGEPQPLGKQFPIVNDDGTPSDYFIRWAQERQIDIQGGITAAQAQDLIDNWAANIDVNAGTALSGGGPLSSDVTINHENSSVTPGSYTNTNLTVDERGHITAAANGSGGGGGGNTWAWGFDPPLAASFALQSSDANNLVLTDDADVGMLVSSGTLASAVMRQAYITLTNPTLAWTMTAKLNFPLPNDGFGAFGLLMHNTVSGRQLLFGHQTNERLNAQRWGGIGTGFSSAPLSLDWYAPSAPVWHSVVFDGTNYLLNVSANGKNWITMRTEPKASWVEDSNRVGIYIRTPTSIQLNGNVPYFSLTGPGV